MYPSDGSRAGLQGGVVFTDHVDERTRCSFGVWAAAEGSASWHIEEARQARQWFDDRLGKPGEEKRKKLDHPPQSPRRRETAGCSNARSA